MATELPLYPYKLTYGLRRYRFGGRRIPERYPNKGVPEGIIAETWEITEHHDDVSAVKNGPLAGKDLRSLVRELGPSLLGERVAKTTPDRFPLLMKFLDAHETLGMQVHPDDDYAAAHEPGEMGKTEAWYIMEADPGAILYCGNVPGLTKAELQRAIDEGNPERCMAAVAVSAGDTIYVPSGRMHAIGAGILVYEAQQSCDLTYGPFGRPNEDPEKTRERIRKFVEATKLEDLGDQRIPPVSVSHGANSRTYLLANRYFAMERLNLSEPWFQRLDGQKFIAYSTLEGAGRIDGGGQSVEFERGESFIVPAGMGDFTIVPSGSCELLVSYVPDIVTDVIAPLREFGVSPLAIAALGGPGASNDVAPLLDLA